MKSFQVIFLVRERTSYEKNMLNIAGGVFYAESADAALGRGNRDLPAGCEILFNQVIELDISDTPEYRELFESKNEDLRRLRDFVIYELTGLKTRRQRHLRVDEPEIEDTIKKIINATRSID